MLIGAVALTAVEWVYVASRRGRVLALDTVVSCRGGHRFTTWWIPGASVKSLRLVFWRIQFCPVGRHWSLVGPVRVSTLSEGQLREAQARHDWRLP